MVILLNITKGETGNVGILSQGVENPNWKEVYGNNMYHWQPGGRSRKLLNISQHKRQLPPPGKNVKPILTKVKSSFLIPCWVSYHSRALSGPSQEPNALVILRVYFLIKR